jgi:hypothetical protein
MSSLELFQGGHNWFRVSTQPARRPSTERRASRSREGRKPGQRNRGLGSHIRMHASSDCSDSFRIRGLGSNVAACILPPPGLGTKVPMLTDSSGELRVLVEALGGQCRLSR